MYVCVCICACVCARACLCLCPSHSVSEEGLRVCARQACKATWNTGKGVTSERRIARMLGTLNRIWIGRSAFLVSRAFCQSRNIHAEEDALGHVITNVPPVATLDIIGWSGRICMQVFRQPSRVHSVTALCAFKQFARTSYEHVRMCVCLSPWREGRGGEGGTCRLERMCKEAAAQPFRGFLNSTIIIRHSDTLL